MTQDVRYALRSLRKNPGFTAVAVLSIALGIGANTTIFSAVYAALLERPPYAQPDDLRIVRPTLTPPAQPTDTLRWWSYPMYEAFRDERTGLAELAAFTPRALPYNLAGSESPRRVQVEIVSASYFGVLDVAAAIGRTFAPEEDVTRGTHRVAVVSHDLWRTAFGGDSSLIGRDISLNTIPLTVVGVMPAGFTGLSGQAEVWVPMMMAPMLTFPNRLAGRLSFWHAVVGRVDPDGSSERVMTMLRAAASSVAQRIPLTDAFGDVALAFVAVPLAEARVDPALRGALIVLLGAVGVVLLIACVNVANLLLARGSRRRREVGIRVALGVGRSRLARQLLVESVVLGIAGGVVALAFTIWGLDLLRALRPPVPTGAVGIDQMTVSLPVLVFNFSVAAVAGIAFGIIPSVSMSRVDPHILLQEGMGARQRTGPWAALVVVEVGLAVVLLIGAGLMTRSFAQLYRTPLGFEGRDVLTAYVNVPDQAYAGDEALALFEGAVRRLATMPGVRRAAVGNCLPIADGCDRVRMRVRDRTANPDTPALDVWMNMVSPEYFAALGIPVIAGRTFSQNDDGGAARVAVVNRAAARRYWPGQDPVGERIQLSVGWGPEDDWAEIVGVVGDVKLGTIEEPASPGVYLSYQQYSYMSNYLLVQAAEGTDPRAHAEAVRVVMRGLDANLPIWNQQTMRDITTGATARTRFSVVLLALFGGVALTLAAVGIYGVLAFSVAGRTREIGVRVAVGARSGDVVVLVFREGLRFVLWGVVAGLSAAVFLTRLLRSQLYQVSPLDAATFIAVAAILAAVAAGAIYVPARRAARIDPVEALRYE